MTASHIDILFAGINFFIFIGIVVVIFKRSLLPNLKEHYLQEQHDKDLLIQRMHHMEEQRYLLDIRIQEEERLFQDLTQKVHEWQQRMQDKQEKDRNQRAFLRAQLEDAERNQSYYYEIEKINKLIKQDALQQAEKNLKETFRDATRRQAFTRTALSNLMSQAHE